MEAKKGTMEAVLGIFGKLSTQQRLMIGVLTVGTIVLLGLVFFVFNEPNYSALYTNLAQEDASKVVEHLTSQKVPYKLEDNGQTIRVPKEKVYEIRLALASKGIPSSGIIGYEIFDKTTMGMSEFMQKLNYKRALEGELSRTIMQQEGIGAARVHIVVPQKALFREDEKEPTASVVLKIKDNGKINQQSIRAIANLISSSVEGLKAEKVTIVDTQGRLLSKEFDSNPLAVSSSKQYEIKQSIENYMAQKAQNLLDNVLGYGNSMVQVNAELNFDQVEKTMELYDPNSQVAISEQSIKGTTNGNAAGDSTSQQNENSTTNYEISKTMQRVVEGTGNIKRLTVSAAVNGIAKEVKKGDKVEIKYEPRSEEQLRDIERLVRNAVGVDSLRKDQISIVNMSFENKLLEESLADSSSGLFELEKYSNFILIFIAVGASMFLLKGLMNKLKNEKILIGTVSPAYAMPDMMPSMDAALPESSQAKPLPPAKKKNPALMSIGDIEDEITDEAVQKKVKQEKISNYVTKNPADAARLINAWLHEDEN